MDQKPSIVLDAQHHAVLFGCLTRSTLQAMPEAGPAAVKEAVILYGIQRGTRMAMRAKAAGYPLDMVSYQAFREWEMADSAAAHTSAPCDDLDLPYHVTRSATCPWHAAWKQYGMEQEGVYYCSDVDTAILKGFNPELTLEVKKLLSRGDDCCEMHWKNDIRTEDTANAIAAAKKDAKVLGWNYHLCHLYCSFISVLAKYPQCREILSSARKMFEEIYGPHSLDAMEVYMTTNFASLPKEG